jgi:hypothetical protein
MSERDMTPEEIIEEARSAVRPTSRYWWRGITEAQLHSAASVVTAMYRQTSPHTRSREDAKQQAQESAPVDVDSRETLATPRLGPDEGVPTQDDGVLAAGRGESRTSARDGYLQALKESRNSLEAFILHLDNEGEATIDDIEFLQGYLGNTSRQVSNLPSDMADSSDMRQIMRSLMDLLDAARVRTRVLAMITVELNNRETESSKSLSALGADYSHILQEKSRLIILLRELTAMMEMVVEGLGGPAESRKRSNGPEIAGSDQDRSA